MTIKIRDKEYKMRYTLRAMIIFEKIAKKPFSVGNLTDQLLFFYATLLANNEEMKMSFDELIDAADENPQILKEFLSFLMDEQKREEMLSEKGGEQNNEGKKKV